MNRIYQGRVSSVEIQQPDGRFKQISFAGTRDSQDQSTCPLTHHHGVFQDAVNYYLVALASLSNSDQAIDGDLRVMQDLRKQLTAAWERFPREDAARKHARSLRDSVSPWLMLSSAASLTDAFEAILMGNKAEKECRALALALVLSKCAGDSGVQQGGREYFPRLCIANYKGKWDFSNEARSAGVGKQRLAAILHGTPSQRELEDIAAEMDLAWTVAVDPETTYEGDDAKNRIKEALTHLSTKMLANPSDRLREWLQEIPDSDAQIAELFQAISSLPETLKLRGNRKAAPDLKFASIAFMAFPCQLTRMCLRLGVKEPGKAPKKPSGDANPFAMLGDDPIRMARDQVGYVFPAFTTLTAWSGSKPGAPAWKEFDIAAFKEALKALNQFSQKTKERDDTQADLRGTIAHLLGGATEGWKPKKAESEEDVELPAQLDPALLTLALQLESQLSLALSESVLGEAQALSFGGKNYAYRDGGWTVTGASLRGFCDIAEDWNKLFRKHGKELTSEPLVEVVKSYQQQENNKRSIGSVQLFLTLCEREFWPLWQVDRDTGGEEEGQTFVNRFLYRLADFHDLVRDYLRSQEPIKLTTAEPRYSRRLYMFSDLSGRSAPKFGKGEANSTVEVSLAARDENGQEKEVRAKLHFSAPRLVRDQLLGVADSRWLQPMTAALGLEQPAPSVSFESAVSLMPDFDQAGNLRFLLNFPKTLETDWIHQGLGRAHFWKGQFNGIKGKNLHLHWPGTAKTDSAKRSPWWENPIIQKSGFTVLSTDLGQRSAGAWALLRVTAGKPVSNKPVRIVGSDGTRTWFAEVLASGMHRLPGEDVQVRSKTGTMERELSGKAGRNALPHEWEQAKQLAIRLRAADPENWVGASVNEKSFPEQNDALLALANRRLSRLSTFHRWSCFDPNKADPAKRVGMIHKLGAELAEWSDPQVLSWKALLDAGDFAAFQAQAGAAFARYRLELNELLVSLANRVCPVRGKTWEWQLRDDKTPYGDLVWAACDNAPWVRGQRGLSMARLEQLESLRRIFLRYNRALDRESGQLARFGRLDEGRASGEPCQLLLEKIDQIKEQRVNQTAHLILAQALGVRLREHTASPKDRVKHDIHGEYEQIPGRTPVDFIVIENLERYLTSQGRAPSENSRLMKWSHRAIRDKIKMLAEDPFGIPVVETAAAYSSRFCAVTGEAGSRCEERPELDAFLSKQYEKRADTPPAKGQQDQRAFYKTLLEQFEKCAALNKTKCTQTGTQRAPRTLLIPKTGGPLFLGAREAKLTQADMNAAINLGLRAVAAPGTIALLHKIRVRREAGLLKPVSKTARETVAFGSAASIEITGASSGKLDAAKAPNFFYDAGEVALFDRGYVATGKDRVPVASGIGLWGSVNTRFLARIVSLNAARLKKWVPNDEIPM